MRRKSLRGLLDSHLRRLNVQAYRFVFPRSYRTRRRGTRTLRRTRLYLRRRRGY